ncbi:MFS transporter [Parasphingorhabdus pacifica]
MPAVALGSGRRSTGHVSEARVLAAVALVVTVGVFPVFFVGGMGVQLQTELDFGAAKLGVATASFFGVAALSSRLMGSLVERIGASGAMRLAVVGSSACLFGLSVVGSPGWLIGLLCLAGIPTSLAQPSANLLIAQGIPVYRRGLAFGVKQSAIPAATLLAGVAVPAIALTIGWRWAFVFSGLIGLTAVALVPKLPQSERSTGVPAASDSASAPLRALLLLAIAGALGSAAANALGAFVTTTAVEVGFSPSAAGLVLSVGSAVGLAVRLLAGAAADRRNPDLVRVITVMLFVGSLGYALMAVDIPPVFLLGVSIGFGAGWSWPGLLNFAVAKIAPDRVASATSFTQTGVYIGGSSGPLLFGLLAAHVSLAGAWLAAGVSAIVAGIALLFVRR